MSLANNRSTIQLNKITTTKRIGNKINENHLLYLAGFPNQGF